MRSRNRNRVRSANCPSPSPSNKFRRVLSYNTRLAIQREKNQANPRKFAFADISIGRQPRPRQTTGLGPTERGTTCMIVVSFSWWNNGLYPLQKIGASIIKAMKNLIPFGAAGGTIVSFIAAANTEGLLPATLIIIGICLAAWILTYSIPPSIRRLKVWRNAIKSHQTLINEVGQLRVECSTLNADLVSLKLGTEKSNSKQYAQGQIDLIASYIALFPQHGMVVGIDPVAGRIEDSDYVIYAKAKRDIKDYAIAIGARYIAKSRDLGSPIAVFVVHSYDNKTSLYRILLSAIVDSDYIDALTEGAKQHTVPDNLVLAPDELFTKTLNEVLENGN